ncbi:MAG: antitoxin [Candidatus Aminicenantes bacterium]|nr:antitoxin [Candidatus Aminicenantes bacterium]
MRTTVTIDDDVLSVAQALAARKGVSLGNALSVLARRGFRRTRTSNDDSIPVFRVEAGTDPITSEDVQRALSDWP